MAAIITRGETIFGTLLTSLLQDRLSKPSKIGQIQLRMFDPQENNGLCTDILRRNPFPSLLGATALPADGSPVDWLQVGPSRVTWALGDNIQYQGSCIRVRSVNREMADYIIDHFDAPDVTPVLVLAYLDADDAQGPVGVTITLKSDCEAPPPNPNTPAPRTAFPLRDPIHVVGTPGTGKSAFAMYLIHCVMARHPDDAIVYRHGEVNPGFFLQYGGITWCHSSIYVAFHDPIFVKMLTKNLTRPVWAFLDGAAAISTGTPEVRQILFVSPGVETAAVKGFLKPATSIVNPPWTLEELESVRAHAYGTTIFAAELLQAFATWGGVPRICLDWANRQAKLDILESTITLADPKKLFRQVGLARVDHDTVSGIHFHLVPGQKVPDTLPDAEDNTTAFKYPTYCWASASIQDRVWNQMKTAASKESMMRFIIDQNNVATARAYAFEPHIFHALQEVGLYGEMKSLTPSKPMCPQSLKGLQRVNFAHFDEIKNLNHRKIFYVPVQKNYTSVDFYVPDHGLMIQIAIGQTHGVRLSGLEAAKESRIFDLWSKKTNRETPSRLSLRPVQFRRVQSETFVE